MKKTIVDQIEITRDGHIQVRMKKQVVDGSDVFEIGYHRTAIEVGGDVDAQMAAVNDHLIMMGNGSVEMSEIAEIKKYAAIAFAPEKIKAYRDMLDASEKSLAGKVAVKTAQK